MEARIVMVLSLDGQIQVVEQYLELPFAPYVGLEIALGGGGQFVEVEEVTWWPERGSFNVQVRDPVGEDTSARFPIEGLTLQHLIDGARECGWKPVETTATDASANGDGG